MGVSHRAPSKSANGWYMYIRHFTNKKGARAKRHPAIIEWFLRKGTLVMTLIVNSQKGPFSKIVTGDVLIVYWSFFSLSLVTVPEVFAKVNSAQSLLLSKVVNLHDKKKNYLFGT